MSLPSIVFPYRADHSQVSLLRNGRPIAFDQQEALDHARLYIGMRGGKNGLLYEIQEVFVEGDEEAGVIIAITRPINEFSHF